MWNNKEMSQLGATLTRVSLTLNFQGQIVPRGWKSRFSWYERDESRLDVLMWNTKEMRRLDAALTGVPLALNCDLEFSRSNCNSGMGGPIVMERKRLESIGSPELKHNHYMTSRQMLLLGTGDTLDVGVYVESSSLGFHSNCWIFISKD